MDQWDKIESPKINSYTYRHLIFDKEGKNIQWRKKKIASSCPWDFPGKNTGVGCHLLLQEIFLTQGLHQGLLHCRQMLNHLEPPGKILQ